MLCYSNVVMRLSQQLNELKLTCLAPLKVSRRLLTGRASFRQRLAGGCFSLAVVALFVFFSLAGHGEIDLARWLNPCGFKQQYNLPCPTCGMTNSVIAFSKGEILESFHIQPASALLCCILVISAILAFIVAVFGVYFRFLKRFFNEVKVRHLIFALIVIITAGWAVTLARALAQR